MSLRRRKVTRSTHCIRTRESLPLSGCPGCMGSERWMEEHPTSMNWPLGTLASCQKEQTNQIKRGESVSFWQWGLGRIPSTHTLWTTGPSKKRLSKEKKVSLESNILMDYAGVITSKKNTGRLHLCQRSAADNAISDYFLFPQANT